MKEEKKGEKGKIPTFVVSVQVQPPDEHLRVALGVEEDGAMAVNFQDTSEMNQDNRYINEAAFPNSAIMTHGKYAMLMSMFTRHVKGNDNEKLFIGKEKKSKD